MKKILFLLCVAAFPLQSLASDSLFTGMQKYKSSRVEQFLLRMDRSAARVVSQDELSVSISFSNYHQKYVDTNLIELISNHDRELPFTSVVFHVGDPNRIDDFGSAKVLDDMGVYVKSTNGISHCKVNKESDCRVFTIQFYTTEKGK